MLPQYVQQHKASAHKTRASIGKPSFAYGLTIRLRPRYELKTEPGSSEQVITLEHQGCEVKNLMDSLEDPLIKEHLFSTQPVEATALEFYQQEHFDIGLAIIVPENGEAVVDLTRTLSSDSFIEHILIVAKPKSKLTIIDKYDNQSSMKLSTVELIAQQGARVRLAQVQTGRGFDATSFRAKISKDAKVDWFIASLSTGFTRHITDNFLEGEGADANSYGVYLGTGQEQLDISASSLHRASNTTSDMYTRGVLDGKAKAVYRGLIDIAADAAGCNGYQTEETVLLSEDAIANAIPNLEIRNNDVACSHGATIGRLDEEKLFYLTSRGISEEQATRMVVEGFFEPVARKLEWPELFTLIQPLVQEKVR